MRLIKITVASIIILNLFAPVLCFGQIASLDQPKDINQAKQIGQRALEVVKNDIPGLIERIWQNEVIPVWQKMYNWVKLHIWDWLVSGLNNLWPKIVQIFKEEVTQRKPVIEQQFQNKKQEIKEEAPQVGQSLWEKFKGLFR